MSRNNRLYLIIGALVVLTGLAAYIYREESKPKGIEMTIGENGVRIQEK